MRAPDARRYDSQAHTVINSSQEEQSVEATTTHHNQVNSNGAPLEFEEINYYPENPKSTEKPTSDDKTSTSRQQTMGSNRNGMLSIRENEFLIPLQMGSKRGSNFTLGDNPPSNKDKNSSRNFNALEERNKELENKLNELEQQLKMSAIQSTELGRGHTLGGYGEENLPRYSYMGGTSNYNPL
mmetsp:Transcript_20879/g.32233  ORF Transcript_20879/g.32233 Transcript_20879/m.32233 type:complete len:183 (-) Transcript_20879:4202-4750(-)